MSYFGSAEEAARALDLPLYLRADPDPGCLLRHDRLSRYAAPTVHAARLFARFRDSIPGGIGGRAEGARAVWVAGPWGSLEHLPWAVGLADQLARSGTRVWLAERAAGGPIAALAPGVRPATEGPEGAESVLGTPLYDAASDLAGVRLIFGAGPSGSTSPGGSGAATTRTIRSGWLILADGLPEELDGPYPSADGLDGVVLVASFRDHGRFELESVARGLRAAGHHLLGLVAIGPGGVDPGIPEPVAVAETKRAEPEAPEKAPVSSATVDDPRPVGSIVERSAAVPPVEERAAEVLLVEEHAAEVFPVEEHAAEVLPVEEHPAEALPVEERAAEVLPVEVRPAEGHPPEELPAEVRPAEHLLADSSPAAPEAEAPLDAAEPEVVGDTVVAEEPPPRAVALLSTWERASRADHRRRRVGTVLATIGALLAAVAILYVLFLRPRGVSLAPRVDQTRTVEPRPADPLSTVEREPSRFAATELPGGDAPGPAPSDTGQQRGFEIEPATPPGPGDYVIHLSSFKLRPEAEDELERLRALGIEARSLQVEVPGRGSWYRIVAGRFVSFAEAESVALSWEGRDLIPYAHIAPEGGRGTPVPIGARDDAQP